MNRILEKYNAQNTGTDGLHTTDVHPSDCNSCRCLVGTHQASASNPLWDCLPASDRMALSDLSEWRWVYYHFDGELYEQKDKVGLVESSVHRVSARLGSLRNDLTRVLPSRVITRVSTTGPIGDSIPFG